MKTPNLSLGVVIFNLISSLSLPVALAGMHPGTNPPPGAVWMRAEAAPAAPLRPLAPEAARANALAASSNAVSRPVLERHIKSVPGGARAEFGLHKVFFPTDVNGNRPVTVTAPDGRTLAFRARLLAAHDASTGERWLLGQVRNRVGLIATASTVLYTNAFDSVRADLRYRCTPHGLEQDIILRQRLTLPNGVEPEHVRLEVWTEWIDSPPAARVPQWVDLRAGSGVTNPAPALADDEQLNFVSMKIGAGHAFSLGAPGERVPVAKQFARVQQRDWLIETVDYSALRARLDGLGAAGPLRRGPAAASPEQLLAALAPGATPSSGRAPLQMARAELDPAPGVVLDFAIVCCVPVPPGAISWWPAGGNAHDALGGNPGTLLNNVSYPGGHVGQGFFFNGYDENLDDGDSVRIANAPNLNPAQGLTIDAWVYFTADMAGQNLPLVSKDGWSGRQYLLTKTWGDKLRAHVGITNGAFYYTDGRTVLQPDTWYHVAMTYSAAQSNLALYVNGALDTNVLVQGSLLATAEPLYLGGAPPWQYWWKGGLDEVDLFDRALSAAEIKTIYDAGAAGKISPQCVPPPADLAVWFPGDGHPYDVRGTNVAALQNGAGYAPAVASSGFRLDGQNDGVVAADDPALNFAAGQDFSLELWLQAAATGFNYSYGVQTLVSKRQTTGITTARGWELFLVSGQPGLQLADAAGWANYLAAGTDLRDGGWHHLAVTVDRDDPEGGALYVDGVEVMTFNPTGVPGTLTNAAPLRLGVHPDSGLFCYFGGVLDEVSVYRRALSGSEISQLYEAGGAGKGKADSDGDGLPDWWMMRYFGHATASASDLTLATDDYDGDGVNNLAEFLAGTDPNSIRFTCSFDHKYTSAALAPAALTIEGGVPSSLAVLVDNTNVTQANWTGFTSSLLADLGANEGWHEVLVGLRGRPVDAEQTWHRLRLCLDRTAPAVVLTCPVASTVSQPLLQIQGYSPEPLASLRWDLANAAGTWTNEEGFVRTQYYDTNRCELTTNFFQCYDLELTNGVNAITVRATDRAGNTATTNFSVTLDYSGDTTAPVIQLTWPQDGLAVCGTNFTLRGTLDDGTAQVSAEIVNRLGVTNTIEGLVERQGQFWVEELPLAAGTNWLAVTATDAAGNGATTNLVVVQSGVELQMNPVPESALAGAVATAEGWVSDPAYAVWVNGIEAVVAADGHWSAPDVPVNEGGTATFYASAYPPGQHPVPGAGGAGVNPPSAQAQHAAGDWDKPAYVRVLEHQEHTRFTTFEYPFEDVAAFDLEWWHNQTSPARQDVSGPGYGWSTAYTWPPDADLMWGDTIQEPARPGQAVAGSGGNPWTVAAPRLTTGHCNVSNRQPVSAVIDDLWQCRADTVLQLVTGGKSQSRRRNLFSFAVSAYRITDPRWWGGHPVPYAELPAPRVTVGVLGPLGSDRRLYKVLPDDRGFDVTPTVDQPLDPDSYLFSVNPTKHKLQIQANGTTLAPDAVVPGAQFCVGQYVSLTQLITPALPLGTQKGPIKWLLDGIFVNQINAPRYSDGSTNYDMSPAVLTNEETHAWWVSGQFNPPGTNMATLGEGLTFPNGQYVAVTSRGKFSMHRPRLLNFTKDVDGHIGVGVRHPHPSGTSRYRFTGIADRLGVDPPARYAVDIESIGPFSGRAGSTQVFYGILKTSNGNGFDTHGGTDLDNDEFYYGMLFELGVSSNYKTNVWLSDSPFTEMTTSTNATQHEDFSDYIRFKPDVGPGPNIFVTIGLVTWHAYGNTMLLTVPGTTNVDFTPFATESDSDNLPEWVQLPDGDAQMDDLIDWYLFPHWWHTQHNPE